MNTAKIKICKKVVIDRSTKYPKAQDILKICFSEIADNLNSHSPGLTNWKIIKKNKPDAIGSLKNKAFLAAKPYLDNLKWDILDEFSDILKINMIPFKDCIIDILDGDFSDINTFKIAILFYTDELTLIDFLNNKLLLTFGDKTVELNKNEILETFMIELGNDLMITSFEKK